MYRSRPTIKKSSTGGKNNRLGHNSSNHAASDSMYLIQNENDILKTKNIELSNKCDALSIELRERTYRVSEEEKQCQFLRDSISQVFFTKDIELESDRKALVDKISLSNQKMQAYHSKIQEARRAVIEQEQKMASFIQERKSFEEELRVILMDNEGSKVVLKNLEDENEELRSFNADLSMKKFSYEPEEKTTSTEIQERIRHIKNITATTHKFKREHSAKLLHWLLEGVLATKMYERFQQIDRFGLRKSLLKKNILIMAHFRKNYLNKIKTKVLSAFREGFKPLQEECRSAQIIANMKDRRRKAQVWLTWRNEVAKAEYVLIRKYECQNSLEKVCESLMRAQVFSAFNDLRHHKNSHRARNACQTLKEILQSLYLKRVNSLVSHFKGEYQKLQINMEVEQSAIQQTEVLILGLYFGKWAKKAKTSKAANTLLLYKSFRAFRKTLVLRKKRALTTMLGSLDLKVKEAELLSIHFNDLKKSYLENKCEQVNEQKRTLEGNLSSVKGQTSEMKQGNLQINKNLAMFKLNSYLRKKRQQAFDVWRRENRKTVGLERVYQLMGTSLKSTVNYAFTRIQKKRFASLKVSIDDKIASCEFSYNYLVEENTNIKEVLDKKGHELEKAKFTAILKRLIRREKEAKHKYFYVFMRNGFKCWKVKKSLQMIDGMLNKKITQVFWFVLKQNRKESKQLQRIQNLTNRNDQKEFQSLLRNGFIGLRDQLQRNKRLKRALRGVFERNFELSFYQSFSKIRHSAYQDELADIESHEARLIENIKVANDGIEATESDIEILTNRLKNKETTFRLRKTMTLYRFFAKNARAYVCQYIERWREKITNEKKMLKFVELLDTKSKSVVKVKFLLALQKSKGEGEIKELTSRLEKFKEEYEKSTFELEKFSKDSQERSEVMKKENELNFQIADQYNMKTQHMNQVKVQAFWKHWDKNILKFVFREWKIHRVNMISKWQRVMQVLNISALRDSFDILSSELKFEVVRQRIKRNLSAIYKKCFIHNASVGFKIWRNVAIQRKVVSHQFEMGQNMKGMENIEQHYQMVRGKYLKEVDFRINRKKLAKLTHAWKQYTLQKISNSQKQLTLIQWLSKGHASDLIVLLQRNKVTRKKSKSQIEKFKTGIIQGHARRFLSYLYDTIVKKSSIQRLFIDKFTFYSVLKTYQEVFTKIKNFYRNKEANQKDQQCFKIQRVIELFEKKRKNILCSNMRTWRRNQYLMQIEKNLLKRVTRRAMNCRVRDLFYAWKLQREAKFVLYEHTEEGQVKRRKVEIGRLKKFLEDYKKEKGLLLQNQEGNYVVSPKFQEKKEQQLKRDNILKYKFIARLVLAMNGYQAPVKMWNNLQMYMKIRQKYKTAALWVRNMKSNNELYSAFKIWRNGTNELNRMFQNMERKDLIRILNRQKDKMEMEYSKKVDIEEKVKGELNRYKVLAYQDKRKQKLCAQILIKEARKVKSFAFEVWRKHTQEHRAFECYQLEDRGSEKLSVMESELHELERYEQQILQQNNALQEAVQEALDIAEMIKGISVERDRLRKQLSESDLSCESLLEENEQLNNKLIQAQKEAMNLLVLSDGKI